MTNLEHGITVDGAKILPVTAYKVVADASNATPLQVTGGASVSGLTDTGTLKVGSTGDTIATIKTYTTAAVNIAAANVVASKDQVVSTTATGLAATDKILSITPTNYVANQFVLGGTITAANNISISIFSAANVNAAAAQTFTVTVLR